MTDDDYSDYRRKEEIRNLLSEFIETILENVFVDSKDFIKIEAESREVILDEWVEKMAREI